MKKNTKKILSIMTVAGLSVSTLTSNIENLANAKEDITSIAELTNSADRLSTEVIENEAGAVIRVSAHANIQNVKTTYAVDNTKSQVVSFGDLKAGEVREIQVNLEENSNTAKVLPKTSVVSDKVEFAKEVKGHKIKGNVTFTYDDGRVFPGGNEVGKPSIPSESNKPGTPSEPGQPNVPGDAPSVPAEELKVTRSVDMDGTELEVVEGEQPAKTGVVKFGTKEYTHEKTETKDGITTHYYKLVESQVPGDAPSVPMEELKVTRSVDLEGTELLVEEGTQEHKVGEVDFSGKKYTYVRSETKDGITTHFYKKVEAQNPEFSGIDAGLPKNVKWTRTQLQKWGFGIGNITGDYKVDGDLGTFATEDELDAAYTKGRKALNEAKYNNLISDEDYANAPKSMLNEIEPGPAGFSGRLYDKNQIGNDGPRRAIDEEDEG